MKKLLRLSPSQLIQTSGIGLAKYAALKAAIELGRRYLGEQVNLGDILNNQFATQQFLAHRLRDYANEVFACLFLDTHFRLIRYEELFHGTINEANIYPREIVRKGLLHNAANVILAHNHPSGRPTPSVADKDVTRLIKTALALVDIQVVDHIIIGNPENFSFAQAGLI